jgi:hypothetical protein
MAQIFSAPLIMAVAKHCLENNQLDLASLLRAQEHSNECHTAKWHYENNF